MVSRVILGFGTVALLALSAETTVAFADEPKPTPDNTIHVELTEPVKPQAFARPLKFSLTDVTDRSGNAQPMLVYKPRSEERRVGKECRPCRSPLPEKNSAT